MQPLKDLKEIFKHTFVYRKTALTVVFYNLLFVVFNLLSLVLFIPVLQLIFSAPSATQRYEKPNSPNSILEVGSYCKEAYNYFMGNLVKNDPSQQRLVFDPSIGKIKQETDWQLNKSEQIMLYQLEAKLKFTYSS